MEELFRLELIRQKREKHVCLPRVVSRQSEIPRGEVCEESTTPLVIDLTTAGVPNQEWT